MSFIQKNFSGWEWTFLLTMFSWLVVAVPVSAQRSL